MTGHNIIVMGASAGGVEALSYIASQLPPGVPAAIFIVLHFPPGARSHLPSILKRVSLIDCSHALDGATIEMGRIYIAPPDHLLLLDKNRMRAIRGPKEIRHRPSIDALFKSAAFSHGPCVIGVVLTGYLDDGVAGLQAIKSRGGKTIVQSPDDAEIPAMPQNALAHVKIDHCLPLRQIAGQLVKLANEPAPDPALFPISEELRKEVELDGLEMEEPLSLAP
jgi:two-component system chemotaxis response regulator CheB